MTDGNERPACPDCGWQPSLPGMTQTDVLHDGDGNYYLARRCPDCLAIFDRLLPNYDEGYDLKPEFKEGAELDPDPPEITAN